MKDWADTISPSDALVALRSFPRRWRGLLAQAGDEDERERVLGRRPPDGSPSVQDLLGETAGVLRTGDAELHRALTGSSAPPAAGAGGGIDELVAASEALATRVESVASEEWERAGAAGPGALDVVRRAVAAAADNLRQAERTLAQVKGRPD